MKSPLRYFLMPLLLASLSAEAQERLLDDPIKIRLTQGESAIKLHATSPIFLDPEGANYQIKPGTYRLIPIRTRPARQRFHLFSKTFRLDDVEAEGVYLQEARALGFTPEVITIGSLLRTASGHILDTRVHWISIRQTKTREEAQAERSRLSADGQPVWIQAETVEPGEGVLQITAADSTVIASFSVPLTIRSAQAIRIDNIDIGFWDEQREHLAYTGDIQFRVGTDNKLEILELLSIEEYLRGVLPAEMPWSWELEALKAQAIAARSEVIASLGSRFALEGFDFLGNEQSRAYLAVGGHKPTTDTALRETRGKILTENGRIVPTVFSATCGGWTENNDTVWYGPPDYALRGVSGLIDDRGSGPEFIRAWLSVAPRAYCSAESEYFRWKRTFSEKELRDMINERYVVGNIERIELGDRGVSGRLKWVRIHGSHATETIHKELPIRQAFGGLPSAMFIIDTDTDSNGNSFYSLSGGGRGHGVGMCQNGAQGMALRGMDHTQILKHYFSGVEIERCE